MMEQISPAHVLPAIVIIVEREEQPEALFGFRCGKGGLQTADAKGHIAHVGLAVIGVLGVKHAGNFLHHQAGALGAEAFFGIDSPKTSEYMLAVKAVDLAINHKEVDKPLNKTLHIINDVLTKSAKERQKDEDGKKAVSYISLLVDLTIDFLVKG